MIVIITLSNIAIRLIHDGGLRFIFDALAQKRKVKALRKIAYPIENHPALFRIRVMQKGFIHLQNIHGHGIEIIERSRAAAEIIDKDVEAHLFNGAYVFKQRITVDIAFIFCNFDSNHAGIYAVFAHDRADILRKIRR